MLYRIEIGWNEGRLRLMPGDLLGDSSNKNNTELGGHSSNDPKGSVIPMDTT